MASIVRNISLLSPLFVISLLIVPSSSRVQPQATQSEINSICSKTRNSTYCQNSLKGYPAADDIKFITGDMLGGSRVVSEMVYRELDRLLFNKTVVIKPVALRTYNMCRDSFDKASFDFLAAQYAFQKGDLKVVKSSPPVAIKRIETCRSELNKILEDRNAPHYVQESEEALDEYSVTNVLVSMLR